MQIYWLFVQYRDTVLFLYSIFSVFHVGEILMANISNLSNISGLGRGFNWDCEPALFLIRFGRREISVCRDSRKRFYTPHPLLDCRVGFVRGYIELLVLRKWLIVFSKMR